MTSEAKKKFAVIPAKSKTSVGNSPCLVRTKLNTSKIAPRAPINENKEIIGKPNRLKFRFNAIAITAPRAAPLDTPNVKGAARSFLNKACKIAPATDKAAPVIAPRRILGSLTSNKIRASILLELLREFEKARVQLISVDPIRGEMQSVINNSIKNIDSVFI